MLIALGAAASIPQAGLAQPKRKPALIGRLATGQQATRNVAAFKEGMAALGWKEGITYTLEEHYAEGQPDRLPALAEALAAKQPALILATPVISARAAAKAAPKRPVVVMGGDPVAAGLVASYARPGGMITGLSAEHPQISEKFLELLLAAVPNARRVGFFFSSHAANVGLLKESAQRSAARYRVEARFADAARLEEIEPALSNLAKDGVQALVIMSGSGLSVQRIMKHALGHGWPVVGGSAVYARSGALLSYGADLIAINRRAAYYADRILKGTKPADLPIEQPTAFELVVNMKTAKSLGLTIPPEIIVRATQVLE
jgi:putative ABC transport system substrate-binding protein